MKLRRHLRLLPLALGALATGCNTNGYITSSVSTVLGLDVSENPKTQVPHVRFGYVRTGLYYVPTGKTAYGEPSRQAPGDAALNRDSVKDTPEVVSEIFVHSGFLTDITISEKFAIGPTAVGSDAAVATLGNPAAQAVAAPNGNVTAGPASVVRPVQKLTPVVISSPVKPAVRNRPEDIQAVVKSAGDILRQLSKDQAQKALNELKPGAPESPNPQEEITEMLIDTTTMEQAMKILKALQNAK